MRNKIIAIILCISILSSLFIVPRAQAVVIVGDPGNTASSIWNGIVQSISATANTGMWSTRLAEMALAVGSTNMIVAAKILALMTIQKSVQMMIGKGNGLIIRDYNDYLYIAPHQRAMAEMNSFFNTVSKGRLSSLNYEGIGPNYDAYLVAQARQAIAGQAFTTNLQDQVPHPSQMFATGNMKGIMKYMDCGNNPACYTLVSTAKYDSELAKAKKIAEMEQDKGFLPSKKNGRIVNPAAIAQGALTQIDQLGTQVIMNAAPDETAADLGISAALLQIAQGTAITITARATNYGIADEAGKEAIRNKNDQFPFSLNYNLNTGVGFSAGGVTVNTGVGSVDLQTMIGNTCATAVATIDALGRTYVDIKGKKYNCADRSEITGTAPSVTSWQPPSITCTSSEACTAGPIPEGYFVCNAEKKCVRP